MMNLLPKKIQLNRMEKLIKKTAKMKLICMHLKVKADVNEFNKHVKTN
jgi:hypothetical protein